MGTSTPMFLSLEEGLSILYMGWLMMTLLVFTLYMFWKVGGKNLLE